MLPQYTFALGGTDVVKKFIQWLEDHRSIMQNIQDKYEARESAI